MLTGLSFTLSCFLSWIENECYLQKAWVVPHPPQFITLFDWFVKLYAVTVICVYNHVYMVFLYEYFVVRSRTIMALCWRCSLQSVTILAIATVRVRLLTISDFSFCDQDVVELWGDFTVSHHFFCTLLWAKLSLRSILMLRLVTKFQCFLQPWCNP